MLSERIKQMRICDKCGEEVFDYSVRNCPKCGNSIQIDTQFGKIKDSDYLDYTDTQSFEPKNNMPMKWYKFLIYVSLFLGAIINFANGISYITGYIYTTYQTTPEIIYQYYGAGLQIIDVIYGICILLLAAFAIYTRMRLAKFKKNAVNCILAYLALNILITLLYNTMLNAIFNVPALNASYIGTLIGNMIFIFLNYIYFNKRRHLFYNN